MMVIKINSKNRRKVDKELVEIELMEELKKVYGDRFNFYYKNWYK
jgi:hypothetical protein